MSMRMSTKPWILLIIPVALIIIGIFSSLQKDKDNVINVNEIQIELPATDSITKPQATIYPELQENRSKWTKKDWEGFIAKDFMNIEDVPKKLKFRARLLRIARGLSIVQIQGMDSEDDYGSFFSGWPKELQTEEACRLLIKTSKDGYGIVYCPPDKVDKAMAKSAMARGYGYKEVLNYIAAWGATR